MFQTTNQICFICLHFSVCFWKLTYHPKLPCFYFPTTRLTSWQREREREPNGQKLFTIHDVGSVTSGKSAARLCGQQVFSKEGQNQLQDCKRESCQGCVRIFGCPEIQWCPGPGISWSDSDPELMFLTDWVFIWILGHCSAWMPMRLRALRRIGSPSHHQTEVHKFQDLKRWF